MGQLQTETAVMGDVGVVRLQGSVDASTSAQMEADLRAHVGAGRRRIVVAMQGLSFMSSAGWGLLLGIVKELRAQGGAVALAAMSAEIRHVYSLLGMKAFVKAFGTEEEAAASLR